MQRPHMHAYAALARGGGAWAQGAAAGAAGDCGLLLVVAQLVLLHLGLSDPVLWL
jgi:hypothetical protein